MIKLGARLQAILQEIDYVDTIADIGTDHGKLVVSAILCNRAKRALAVDISKFSLKKAEQLAYLEGVEDKIDFFVGDGFSPLKDRVNIAIVAGMGGLEITNIMADVADKYILVPHQDSYLLRKYLQDNSYHIIKDFVVKDTKFYDIIVASKGDNNYSDSELFLGKNYPQSDFYYERNISRLEQLENIIHQHTENKSEKPLKAEILMEREVIIDDKVKRNY